MNPFTRRQNAPGYEARLGSISSHVGVGGETIPADKFVPMVVVGAHRANGSDEAFVSMNYDGSPMVNISEILEANGVLENRHAGAKLTHKFKADQTAEHGEHCKWDMAYDSAGDVPNSISFRIRHSNNLTFHKQPDTPHTGDADFAPSQFACPEVAGSYAVYINGKRNNKYQTGKIMHLYSAFFVCEATGERSPLLPMNISPDVDNAKRLTMTVSAEVQAWLDAPERIGKVTLDPILGYDIVGASNTSIPGGWFANESLASVDGNIVSFHAAIAGGNGKIKMGAANCDQTPPYSPVGYSYLAEAESLLVVAEDDHVLDDAFFEYAPVVAGKYYKVGAVTSGSVLIKYDIVSTNLAVFYPVNYPLEMQDPVPAGTFSNAVWLSIWAVYEEAGGNAMPPHLFGPVR